MSEREFNMKQQVDKIVEIAKNNKTISKHLAPSYTTIRLQLGYDPQIIASESRIDVYVDTHKNIFTKTIEKIKRENRELIKDAMFWKSDGECSSCIVVWLNEKGV